VQSSSAARETFLILGISLYYAEPMKLGMSKAMFNRLAYLIKEKVGFRTIYKSWRVYSKSKANIDGRPLKTFLISGGTNVSISGSAKISHKGTLSLGLGPHLFAAKTPATLIMNKNSKLSINGSVFIGKGAYIEIFDNAQLIIGDHVSINSESRILCKESISIGNDAMISWGVEILDSDFHQITYEDDCRVSKPIVIGDHVWIGSHVIILKGVTIDKGAVVAAGAVVTKNVPSNCVVAGVPAKIIRKNIKWKR